LPGKSPGSLAKIRNAYERWAICAKKQPDRDDDSSLTVVDGFSMKYQQTLSLGVNPGETFDQIDQTLIKPGRKKQSKSKRSGDSSIQHVHREVVEDLQQL